MISNYQTMNLIRDYDIVTDNPKKHIPYAMFCSTADAISFMEKLKKEKQEVNWQVMKLEDWQKVYNETNP